MFCANLAVGYEHLWSLSFEEQFIVLAVDCHRSPHHQPVDQNSGNHHPRDDCCDRYHLGAAYHSVANWCYEFHATEDRADALLWGCLAAHLWVRGWEPTKLIRILIWPAVIFLLACLPFSNLTGPFLYKGGFDLIDLSSAIVLLALMGGTWSGRRFFEWTPLVKLGLIAYAFYLWHVTIFFIIARIDHGWNYVLRVVVAFGWTLAMALLSWFLLKNPCSVGSIELSLGCQGQPLKPRLSPRRGLSFLSELNLTARPFHTPLQLVQCLEVVHHDITQTPC